jgi:hypothetical protein
MEKKNPTPEEAVMVQLLQDLDNANLDLRTVLSKIDGERAVTAIGSYLLTDRLQPTGELRQRLTQLVLDTKDMVQRMGGEEE